MMRAVGAYVRCFVITCTVLSVVLLSGCDSGVSSRDPDGAASATPEARLDAAQVAIRIVESPGDPWDESDAVGELVELSQSDEAIVDTIVEAMHDDSSEAKSDLASVLWFIWTENHDDRARSALLDLLGDPDVRFQVALGLAQEGDAAGADVLRAVGAQNAGSFGDAQDEAEEARYWLRQLGLDMTGAPSWTDSIPLSTDGLGTFEGHITQVKTPEWGDGLSQIVVSVSGLSDPVVVSVPWSAQVISTAGSAIECSDFLDNAAAGSYRVRVSAEDVAGCPWAVTIQLLGPE